MVKAAFLGLGVMGYPMARHLKARGHDVTVYNRTVAKAQKWVAEHGGRLATTPMAAAEGQDIVFACVGNDDDLRQVTLGAEGAFQAMRQGAVFVDHTTASAGVARELHAAATGAGFGFLDAPVSGGQAGAENGQLTVMVGGEQAVDVGDRAEQAERPPLRIGHAADANTDQGAILAIQPAAGSADFGGMLGQKERTLPPATIHAELGRQEETGGPAAQAFPVIVSQRGDHLADAG